MSGGQSVGGDRLNGRAARAPQEFDLTNMSQDDLLVLRVKIDGLISVRSLKDLDLQRELVIQLLTMQRLQNETMGDLDVPPNQKSQVAGQVSSSLTALGKLQVEVYDSERLKKIEAVLIEVLKTMPMKQQEAFLKGYEDAVGGVG